MSFTGMSSDEPGTGLLLDAVGLIDSKRLSPVLRETQAVEILLELNFDFPDEVMSILSDGTDFTLGENGKMSIRQGYTETEIYKTELSIDSDKIDILVRLFGEDKAYEVQDYVTSIMLQNRPVLARIVRS